MRNSYAAVGVAAALSAGTAFAHQDGPMATAGASGAPPTAIEAPIPPTASAARRDAPVRVQAMSTAEQIDDFIRSSPAAALSPDEMAASSEGLEPERRVHGSVELGVGTHGYRHAGVEAHYPLGKTGHVSVAVGATRGRGVVGACPGGALGGPYGGGLTPFPGPQGCYAPW